MHYLLKSLLAHAGLMAPADDDGSDNGGAVDRGDEFDPLGAEGVDDKADDSAADDSAADDDKDADDDDAADDDKADDKEDDDLPPKKAKKDDGDDGKARRQIRVPKARLDQEIAARKALEQRLADLTKQSKKEAEDTTSASLDREIAELENKYDELLADGETKKANEIMRAIRAKERQAVELRSEQKSERARVQAVEQIRLDTLIEKLEADFPALDPDATDYDQEAVDEVMLLRGGFEKQGMTSTDALARAVKYVLGTPAKKAAADEPKKGLGDGRRQSQTKKNLDAEKRIPGRVDRVGVDSDRRGENRSQDVTNMSEEEFNSLPESTKARLRGDLV